MSSKPKKRRKKHWNPEHDWDSEQGNWDSKQGK